jgi:hypothetical protein
VSEANLEQHALVNNSALIRVKFGVIGNSKRSHVEVNTTADKDRFRVSKTLLKSGDLEAISKADFKVRQWLDKESVPFDMGVKLVSMKKIGNIIKVLNEYRDVERPALVSAFKSSYPSLLLNAQEELGPEFNPDEFVPIEKLEAEFEFDYKILGFEVPGSLKTVSKLAYEEEVAKAAEQIKSVTHEIEQAQRALLLSLIDTLDDKLSEDKIPTQKAIEKLQKFLSDFEINDVTNDTDTAKLVEDLKSLTQGVSAKSIKTTEGFQAQLTAKIIDVQKSLEEMVEVRPARRIKEIDND